MSIERETLERAREAGLSPFQLATQLAVHHTTVLRAEKQEGVMLERSLRRGGKQRLPSHREIVQDMKLLDAVEYLLGVIEDAIPPEHVVSAWKFAGVHFTLAEKRIIQALANAGGRVVSKEAMLDAATMENGDPPDILIINVYICKIRRKAKNLPFQIITHWGLGYSIEASADYVWPWEVQV